MENVNDISKTDELHRITVITGAALIRKVAELNQLTGIPIGADPATTPLIYLLEGDYTDAYLLQRSADGRGTRTIFGYTTPRALYALITFYIAEYKGDKMP